MSYIPIEGIRTILSSVSFGMDDRYDRLIRKKTTLMILFGSLIIASNRFFGLPITCATTELPQSITQHWVDTLCWLNDKKFAPIQFIGSNHIREKTSYYQFSMESLLLIALLFNLPGKIWLFILGQSGYNIKRIATLISQAKQSVENQRMTYIKALANHVQISRRYHRVHLNFDEDLRRRLSHCRTPNSTRSFDHYPRSTCQNRYFLPISYVIIKIFYIVMIFLVYLLLEHCLGFKYMYFGFTILSKIQAGNTSTFLDERFFPQRTFCLVTRARLGGNDVTWADCVLPINIINNIIFSLLWFWLAMILLISIFNFFWTIYKMQSSQSSRFLGQHLEAYNLYDIAHNGVVLDFIKKCPPDIILILRLYESELGETLVGEIISHLFLLHKEGYVSLETSLTEHLP